MSTYFIQRTDTGETYALDSTTEVSITHVGKTSDFPIESGASLQDNYVNKNTTASAKGTIATDKSLTNSKNLTPDSYMRALQDIKKDRVLFDFFWHGTRPPLKNCVFSSLSFSQSTVNGYTNSTTNSVGISFSLQEVRFAYISSAEIVSSADFKDKTSETGTGDSTTSDLSEGDVPTGMEAKILLLQEEQQAAIDSVGG